MEKMLEYLKMKQEECADKFELPDPTNSEMVRIATPYIELNEAVKYFLSEVEKNNG